MNILSIDTTTKIAGVALKCNNNVTLNEIENEITHSEKLLPLIDKTLKENNKKINDIDLFAVLNGPGSFTGVRIGLASIKAFSLVTKKDIFSMSSLEAIAYTSYKHLDTQDEKYILSLIDARNNRVYYGLFKVTTKDEKIITKNILDLGNDLIENVISLTLENVKDNEVVIAGNCINTFKDLLSSSFNSKNLLNLYPTTEDLILDATYVRMSQAERIKNEKRDK